jgi:hypothetical protein
LDDLLVIYWRSLILGKKCDSPRSASTIFKDLDRFTPHLLLAVVDLAKIKHLMLHNLATGHASVLHQIPISVLLAILLSRRAAQKHDGTPLFTENSS